MISTLGDIQNSTGHGPEQVDKSCPCFWRRSRSWIRWLLEVPSNLNDSIDESLTHDSKVLSTIISSQILDSRYNYLSWCIDCFEFYSKTDYIYSYSCHCLYKTDLQSFVPWKIVLHVTSSYSSRNNPIKVCKLGPGGMLGLDCAGKQKI